MLATVEKLLLDKYEQSLKTNTEVAVSLLSAIYDLENMTAEEKFALSRRLVRALRFEGDDYYFVYEEGTGKVLIHGANQKLEGQNLWDLVNPADKTQVLIVKQKKWTCKITKKTVARQPLVPQILGANRS